MQAARQIGSGVVAGRRPARWKGAGIILGDQAADAVLDHVGFIAGRHNRHNGRPCCRLGHRRAVALAQQPEAAMETAADRARSPAAKSRTGCPRSFEIPVLAEPGSASFRPSLVGARGIAQFSPGLFGTEEHAIARHVSASAVRNGSLPVTRATSRPPRPAETAARAALDGAPGGPTGKRCRPACPSAPRRRRPEYNSRRSCRVPAPADGPGRRHRHAPD